MTVRTDSPARAAADGAGAGALFAAGGPPRRQGRRLGGGPWPAGMLSGAQIEVVRLVRRRPGLSVAEAAAQLALAPNTVSTLVGQLADAHVLARVADPQDRRIARLVLTAPARAALERAVPIIARLAAALGPAPDVPDGSERSVRDE
jgi:DNA-binding MarR family transcriptional regulator